MVKILDRREVSIEDLEAMANLDDSARAENYKVLSEAGAYIQKRINAIIHKIPELATIHPLINLECFVLDSNKTEILVVTLNEQNTIAILSVIKKSPDLDIEQRFQGINYDDAAIRFNKRKCGLSLAKALQKSTKKLQASTKKHREELEAFAQAMDSTGIN